MPTKKMQAPEDIYQIKVTLLGTSPPIWRRLLVPADLTLEQLHDVLQLAMGWEDCHLHDFRIGHQRFGETRSKRSAHGSAGRGQGTHGAAIQRARQGRCEGSVYL